MADYTTTTNAGLPDWLQPQAAGYINRAQSVADQPYQAYGGQRVAGFTDWQQQGLQAQAQRGMSGSPTMSAANQALPGMFNGGGTAAANPYGQAQTMQGGAQVQSPMNQYGRAQTMQGGAQISAQANPYAGSNPYLQQNIDSATGDVTRAWNNVQKPQWDTAMSRSGSFGNSGVSQANQMSQSDMQRNLGSMASGMRMQDYTQQQQLGEAASNRNMQAQQFNSGLGEAAANRYTQNSQFNASMGDSEAARGLQASQFNSGLGESAANRYTQNSQFNSSMGEQYAGRQDGMYNQGQGRALQALSLAPSFAQNDYNDIAQMQNAGSAYQKQNQAQLDSSYQQYMDAQNYPQKQLDVFGNALGKLNWGQQSTSTQPGPSTGSQVAGGALTGAALYNLLFGGKP